MYVPECSIGLPDGTRVVANYCGSVQISANLILKNVLFVPNLKCNLISVGCLIKSNKCRVIFDDCCCVLQDRVSTMEIGRGTARNGVYVFQSQDFVSASRVDQVELLHKRLGHPSPTILCSPPFNNTPSDIKQLESCEICF